MLPKFRAITSPRVYANGDAFIGPRFAAGDFNGDGKEDLALNLVSSKVFAVGSTANTGASKLLFYVQGASGELTDATAALTPTPVYVVNVTGVVAAEFNGDGRSDLLLVVSGQDPYANGAPSGTALPGDINVAVVSNASGTYTAFASGGQPRFFHNGVTGDLDGDGDIDAFVVSIGTGTYLLKNEGGVLRATTSGLPAGLADFSKLTTVVSTYSDGWWKEWKNFSPTGCALVDANGDGSLDLVALPLDSDVGYVFLNDGRGDFGKSAPIPLTIGVGYGGGGFRADHVVGTQTQTFHADARGPIVLDSAVFDVNGDGRQDIVALCTSKGGEAGTPGFTYYRGARLSVQINEGNGHFTEAGPARVNFSHDPAANYTHYDRMTPFDLNGDGAIDLVLTRSAIVSPEQADSATDTRFLLNDGHGFFSEVTGAALGLSADLTYSPLSINGKVGLAGYRTTAPGARDAAGDLLWNIELTTFVSDVPATQGSASADALQSHAANQMIDGGAGIDTYFANGSKSGFALAKGSNGFVIADRLVTGSTDQLVNVERVHFDDTNVALDLGGAAGTVVKTLGAVFGREFVHNKAFVGIGLSIADGGMAREDLMQLALDAKLGAGHSVQAAVTTLYTNVVGSAPSADALGSFASLVTSGQMTEAQLGLLAAETALNLGRIDFVGLSASGVEYV